MLVYVKESESVKKGLRPLIHMYIVVIHIPSHILHIKYDELMTKLWPFITVIYICMCMMCLWTV